MKKRYKLNNWGQIVRRELGDESGFDVPAFLPLLIKLLVLIVFAFLIKGFIFNDNASFSDKAFLEKELAQVTEITDSLGKWNKRNSNFNPPFSVKISADFKLDKTGATEQSIISTVMQNLDWKPCGDIEKSTQVKLCKSNYVSTVNQKLHKATLLLTTK